MTRGALTAAAAPPTGGSTEEVPRPTVPAAARIAAIHSGGVRVSCNQEVLCCCIGFALQHGDRSADACKLAQMHVNAAMVPCRSAAQWVYLALLSNSTVTV